MVNFQPSQRPVDVTDEERRFAADWLGVPDRDGTGLHTYLVLAIANPGLFVAPVRWLKLGPFQKFSDEDLMEHYRIAAVMRAMELTRGALYDFSGSGDTCPECYGHKTVPTMAYDWRPDPADPENADVQDYHTKHVACPRCSQGPLWVANITHDLPEWAFEDATYVEEQYNLEHGTIDSWRGMFDRQARRQYVTVELPQEAFDVMNDIVYEAASEAEASRWL